LRLATRGARLYPEEQAIEQLRAARWAAVVPGDVRVDGDTFPPPEEAREAILATAFAGGLDVATENRRDFEMLRDALVTLFPEAPPMAVVDVPL
jgi:hypothetical protein